MITPYRIELGGGWTDQPYINKKDGGAVIVCSICTKFEVQSRSGLATSTHDIAEKLFNVNFWEDYKDGMDASGAAMLAKEDLTGGSQDAYGICMRGATVLYYEAGSKLPHKAKRLKHLDFMQDAIKLKHCGIVRPDGYDPTKTIDLECVKDYNDSTNYIVRAIEKEDAFLLGQCLQLNYGFQQMIVPAMNEGLAAASRPKDFQRWTGAGYGYYITTAKDSVSLPYKIRR